MVPVWMTLSDLFNVMIIQRQVTWKWYNTQLYLQWPTNRKSYNIERRHIQWPWTTPTSNFKVTPFFDAEYLRNGTTYRHSVIEILIGTHARPTHFERPWVTLSDLAKYSMTLTRSVTRSLCDSRASCLPSGSDTILVFLHQTLHVTNNKRLRSRYCTVEANRQTRSTRGLSAIAELLVTVSDRHTHRSQLTRLTGYINTIHIIAVSYHVTHRQTDGHTDRRTDRGTCRQTGHSDVCVSERASSCVERLTWIFTRICYARWLDA